MDPTKKDTPPPRAKEKPQQDSSVQNQTPYPPEMLRGLKQTLWAPGPRDPTETETELCLSVSCEGTGQQWLAEETGALGAAELGVA